MQKNKREREGEGARLERQGKRKETKQESRDDHATMNCLPLSLSASSLKFSRLKLELEHFLCLATLKSFPQTFLLSTPLSTVN